MLLFYNFPLCFEMDGVGLKLVNYILQKLLELTNDKLSLGFSF